MKIALLGDYDETVVAHRAVPVAIDLAARVLAAPALNYSKHPLVIAFLLAAL